jgi:hypothetical protein
VTWPPAGWVHARCLRRVRETHECTGRADGCMPVVVAPSSRITGDLAEARDPWKSVRRLTLWW